MKGKDWFVVGTRLLGLGILFMGFQQALTFLTRGMLFAQLEHFSYFDQTPPWIHLVNGAITCAFGLAIMAKADTLAEWCYGSEQPPIQENEHFDEVTGHDSAANGR